MARYRIDIWNNHSTSETTLRVDEAMKVTDLETDRMFFVRAYTADKKKSGISGKTKDGTVTEFTAQFSVKTYW